MPKKAELATALKKAGLTASGTLEQMAARLKTYGDAEKALLPDGANAAALPNARLKKELASRGLPCDLSIESRDALARRLVDALCASVPSSAAAAPSHTDHADGGSEAASSIQIAVDVAKRALELGEGGDFEGVLSLTSSRRLSRETPFAVLRRAYLNLSRMIHPDKLGRHFDGATRAFQEVVRAFDWIVAPEAPLAAAASKAKSGPVLARSNDRCHRTRVFCPRCSSEWATRDAGLDDWEYNFMMQGLKTYMCALCLCEFGCVSAKHRCPKCGKFLDSYLPQDYHRIIECNKCEAHFGFYLYVIPPRIEAERRLELRATQEAALKSREAKLARLARAQRKAGTDGRAEAALAAESLFVLGLVDACPRCGFEPSGIAARKEELQAHLDSCTDKRAHSAHAHRMAGLEAKRSRKEALEEAQEEAGNLAAWQYLGGSTQQMWLLTDRQLEKQCSERGLEVAGSREDMLLRLASAGGASKLLTQGDGGAPPPRSAKRVKVAREQLPENLHAMSAGQLRAVLASHGIASDKSSSADELVARLEAACDDDDVRFLQ